LNETKDIVASYLLHWCYTVVVHVHFYRFL